MYCSQSARTTLITTNLLIMLAQLGCQGDEQVSREPMPSVAERTSLSISSGGKFDDPAPGSLVTRSLHDLLDVEKRHPLEASGLAFFLPDAEPETLTGSDLYTIFDHFSTAALVPRDLQAAASFLGEEESDFGYEGLTFDARTQRFYALVEAVEKKKRFEPEIHVYDPSWKLLEEHQVDFEVEDFNKGMEGLAHVYHEDTLYLFMLCEGNQCQTNGDRGEGRIYVFALDEEGEEWLEVDRVKIPGEVDFEDYSGLDIQGDRIAIVSQEEGAFFLGKLLLVLDEDGSPDWKIADRGDFEGGEGKVYELPRDEDDKRVFCNVEGIAFSPDPRESNTLYLVSDRRKPEQNKRCEEYDQSIHKVELP